MAPLAQLIELAGHHHGLVGGRHHSTGTEMSQGVHQQETF